MVAFLATAVLASLLYTAGSVDTCSSVALAEGNEMSTLVECTDAGLGSQPNAGGAGEPEYSAYEWRPICGAVGGPPSILTDTCDPLFNCSPDQVPSRRYGLRNGEWFPLQTACRGGTNSPTITPAAVATAFQRIPLPELHSITQPAAKTLVNFDTIFYVEAETLDRGIRLLGQDVDLTITPSRFRWTFGDGTDQVTTTPGRAYPAKTVTHRYQRAHVTVEHQVQVTWTATWRVNNGPWQDVPGSVTITGPSTPLRIAEAVPLLTGGDR